MVTQLVLSSRFTEQHECCSRAPCRCWTAAAVWSGPPAAKLENRRGDSARRVRSL